MNNNVIKPLLKEMLVKTELNSRLRTQYDLNIRDIKKLSTILRIPRMCTEFHKTMRQKNEEEQRSAEM